MPLEPTFNFIDDMDSTNPNNSPDQVKESANHLRGVKNAVQGSFPNLGQVAVVKTAAEINDLVQPATTDTLENKTLVAADFTGTQTGFTGDVVGNLTGNSAGTHTGAVVGNASTASKFNSNRTIALSGDISGSNVNDSGNHTISCNINNDTIRFSNEINNTAVDGSFNITGFGGGTMLVPAGVYNIKVGGTDAYNGNRVVVEYYTGTGGWQPRISGDYNGGSVNVVSDGAHVRVSAAGSYNFLYRKIFN